MSASLPPSTLRLKVLDVGEGDAIVLLLPDCSKAVVVDAAVLIEAGWDELCHDICVVIIPKEEV